MTAAREVRAFWRASRHRASGLDAYGVYVAVIVGLVTVAPLLRLVWLVATDPGAAAAVLSLVPREVVPGGIAAVWAAACITGALRGPVTPPPFLAYALGGSPIPQRRAFARWIWPPIGVGACVGAATAALACLASHTLTGMPLPAAAALVAAGAASGIVTIVSWLAGQVLPVRLVAGAASGLVGAALALWVAAPGLLLAGGAGVAGAGAVLAAAIVLTGAVPWLASRLDPQRVLAQSRAWQTATTHVGALDLQASAMTYQPLPHRRGRFAVRGTGGLTGVFLRRDAIAAARTPERLALGVAALLGGGALLAVATVMPPPAWIGAAGGVAVFAGLGPLTDGLRHIALVSADVPLYGVSDGRLLAAHAALPLLIGTAATLMGGLAAVGLVSGGAAGPAAAACTAVTAVVLRAMSALKPQQPLALLAPVPTPAGDLSAVARVVWALDAVLLAAGAGLAAAALPATPWPLLAVGGAITVVTAGRWRRTSGASLTSTAQRGAQAPASRSE